jgi:hypothetical protein
MTRRNRERLAVVSIGVLGLLLLGLTWTVVHTVTGLLVACAVLVGLALVAERLYRSRPEVLTDGAAIASRLEELRVGASRFSAIWSGQYDAVEVERYFEAERIALSSNDDLRINRVINPSVISTSNYNLLKEIRDKYGDRFKLYENSAIHSFELYVVDYPGNRDAIAVVVVIDVNNRRPTIGLVLDPDRDPRLGGAVAAIRVWFESILEPLPVFDPIAIERWDHMAPRYTRYVTENTNRLDFLERFAAEENRLLTQHLESTFASADTCALIDVGCGDGRILIGGLPEPLADRLSWLVGLDYAAEMIRTSERRLLARDRSARDASGPLSERTRLYRVNALDMQRYFNNGQLNDLEHLRETAPQAPLSDIDQDRFTASRKVFCCMLNTLGVVERPRHRLAVFKALLAALGPDDTLAISVFAAEAFEAHAETLYKGLEKMIDAHIESANFDTAAASFAVSGTPGYYSHWFTEDELADLAAKAMLALADEGAGERVFFPANIERITEIGFFLTVRRARA